MASRFGNYGAPNGASTGLYTQRLDQLHQRCKFEYDDVARAFPSFTMSHFADNKLYDAFEGTDYTPHNLENYPTHSHWRKMRPLPAGRPRVLGGLCDTVGDAEIDGEPLSYTIMRVGPFTSNGGYDWWQFAGHDALRLSRHVSGGRTIGINSHWVVPVEVSSGKPLGYPPMHVHHIHLVPSKPYLRYQWPTPATSSWRDVLNAMGTPQGAAYYVPNYIMEQHGEWDLCDIRADGSKGCFAEHLPTGYTNLLDFELDFEGEINDGREVGATNLTWWLEVGVGWTRRTEAQKPLSYAVLTEDHFTMVDGHQHTYESYHWVPSHGEWVNYYTGRMPHAGSLVRMKHHVHMNLLEKAFFVAGTSEELGLYARPLGPDGLEMGAKEVPGAFFSHAGRFGRPLSRLFDEHDTIDDDHITWPVGVVSPQQLGSSDLQAFEATVRQRAKALGGAGAEDAIICELSRGLVRDAHGFQWDRVGRSDCRSWRFKRGDSFTSVSLLRYHGEKVGPWSPDVTPPRLPSHNQWNLYFEADDDASHYFLYSALIADPTQKLRRYVLRELLLMMNWRIVAAPDGGTLQARLTQAQLGVRRQSPLTLLGLAAGIVALVWIFCGRLRRKWKGD